MKTHFPFPVGPAAGHLLLARLRTLAEVVAVAMLVAPVSARANLKTERFWLENMVTREISGPVLRQTGHRFQIGSQGFVVLDSAPGKIRVATYPQGDPYGPYDIVESRIIDIGLPAAYNIVNVQNVEVPELPPDLSGLVGVYVKGEQKAPPPSSEPEWEPLPISEWPLMAGAWLEPFHMTDYDWKVGGFAGKKALDLKTTRLGVHLNWGNAFVRLGYVADGKQSGSITPDLVSIESLKLRDGSGFSFAGGYLHPFYLADDWDALVGGVAEISSESYNLVARTLVRLENQAPAPSGEGDAPAPETTTYTYEYREASSSLDLREFLATAVLGVQYHEDIWGASGLLCIDLVSNVKADGSLTVNDNTLSLEADRSHPIGVEIGGWCYMFEEPRLEAAVRLGATQLFRVAVSWEW